MKLIPSPPKKSIDKALLKQRPLRSDINLFKTNLIRLLGKIDEIEREENQKNHIRDFLLDTYYKASNEINTKGDIDLVIHTGKSNKDKVGVIIEAKRPSNKNEMLSIDKPNAKAFQELVLYYLRERIEENNIDIKYCIATNIYEWYIIDASYFEKLFYRNRSFVKEYEQWRDGKKVTKDTGLFYNDIAKPFIDGLDEEIPFTYFDIRNYEKSLKNEDISDDKTLIALYKILSPFYLLKTPFANDSNALNEKFYKELLHIIGLEEVKEGNKNIIRRKLENRNPGALIENIINALDTEDPLHRLPDQNIYGATREERFFSIALELSITWINRVLFLKLLEGQLVNYHKGDKQYRFLNIDTVHDFDELFKLFHRVLAINISERKELIQKKYSHVPYLNSSLFEISELEDNTVKINTLDNVEEIELISTTVLKEIKKKNDKLPALEYLFRFLDAYDFSGEGIEDIQEDFKGLINASVLGKVFEKINGYKDGSIYTPGFITMYMCRQSIRLAVMQKFRDAYGWTIDKFDDLKNYLADRKSSKDILEFNALINSLKLCDPAVGSGHYLVSSLNEIIAIKYELGLLADETGNRIRDYEIEVVNDELVITDYEHNIFEYTVSPASSGTGFTVKPEVQRLQRTLFREKQTIIENCLFGVDINPNSVKICRLRLWIELLKNAYYKEETNFSELETLPNIDINIKCGNSLISRFALDADLSKALKSIKYDIKAYRGFVADYKNERNREVKRSLQKIIDTIKGNFRTNIDDPFKIKISKARGAVDNIMTEMNTKQQWGEKLSKELKDKLGKATKKLTELEKEKEEILTNVIYSNAFEWRFEFPELLDDKGDFVGFDIIIGNPPYIESRSAVIDERVKDEILRTISERRKKDAELITRGSDILIYFFELGLCLLKKNGYFSFITQNSWLDTEYGFKFQKFLKNNTEIIGVFDNSIKYFDDSANINTIITLFRGNEKNDLNEINFVRFNVGFEDAPYDPIEIATIQNIGIVNKFKQSDDILESIKWGIILNSDAIIIDLHKRLFENKHIIKFDYRIGQGLNLTKDYIVSKEVAGELKISNENLIPFFTNEDGAPFLLTATKNYLIQNNSLPDDIVKTILEKKIKIIEINSSSRNIPDLILPRGIGRYFCSANNAKAYSSSFVEIYLPDFNQLDVYKKYIWFFLNSSIGWFIREISGRKNLGGGMLKAEAIDLKNYPLLFDFNSDLQEINSLFSIFSHRESQNCLSELKTKEHQEIDDIVFRKLGYSDVEKIEIVEKLSQLINHRITKSKSKL